MRFEHERNEREFVEGLAKEVADRLQKHHVKGKNITVKVTHQRTAHGMNANTCTRY